MLSWAPIAALVTLWLLTTALVPVLGPLLPSRRNHTGTVWDCLGKPPSGELSPQASRRRQWMDSESVTRKRHKFVEEQGHFLPAENSVLPLMDCCFVNRLRSGLT